MQPAQAQAAATDEIRHLSSKNKAVPGSKSQPDHKNHENSRLQECNPALYYDE
jgi:hypothetical protein